MGSPLPPVAATAAMPAISETTISSLKGLMEFVHDHTTFATQLWFRGIRDARYDLAPSLYRHPTRKSPEELRELETELMARFRHRAPPFVDQLPPEDFQLLFLMQHYGVPTRLLDWTENPGMAAFFAVENAREERVSPIPDSAIWVLNPLILNKTALANHAADRVFSIEDALLNAYLPKTPFKHSAKLPVAVGGVHNSRRIVAQRGSFVLFGTNVHGMNADPGLIAVPNLLHKLIIPGASKMALREALFVTGVTDSVVYPDLAGLSREIRFQEGF